MYLNLYQKQLGALSFPADGDANNPYPFYDRWGDSFNTATECVSAQQAEGLAWLAGLMAQSPQCQQPWRAASAHITGLPAEVVAGTKLTAQLAVTGLDLAEAQVVWEVSGQPPFFGPEASFVAASAGAQWVEAEALWPDGRRAFARAELVVLTGLIR